MPRRTGQKLAPRNRARRSRQDNTADASGSRAWCRNERLRLAYESARMLTEQEAFELDHARRKAAARLGVSDRRCWPDNEEIQQALMQQQRLFQPQTQQETLKELRGHALNAMRTFARFAPRLVGPALDGTAAREQGVELLLFAETPEEIVLELLERGIPWQQTDGQFRYAGGTVRTHPVLAFVAGDIRVHLIVLPPRAVRNPPLGPVSERPERGIDADELERLIEAES